MKKEMNIAILLAAGSGRRMGSDKKKQFMELGGVPVLCHSLKALDESFMDHIVLVTGREDEDYCRREILEKSGIKTPVTITEGGRERYHSVYNGICEASRLGADHVFIHDGARPFVDEQILERCLSSVREHGACAAAVPVKDTIKRGSRDGFAVETLKRDELWSMQTPQVFDTLLIQKCYEKLIGSETDLKEKGIPITDDAFAVELFSDTPVFLTMGSYDNIKLTTPEDLILGERILEQRRNAADNPPGTHTEQ